MTILLKNGLIYDGTGGAPAKNDVLIQNGRIAHLGSFSKKTADLLIDAAGMAVTPGLIDINFNDRGTSGILSDPSQENSIFKGITTAVGGSGGMSLAPILGGTTSFIKEWGGTAGHNIHWHSMEEFLNTMEKRGVGLNFGTLTGYPAIRRFFSGGAQRDLTVREIENTKSAVGRAFKEGAFGVSLNLSAPHAQRIPFGEILELARETAKSKRVMAVCLRREGAGLLPAVEEILEIGRATGANIEINHFQPLRDFSETYEEALKILEKEASQSHVDFDVLPHPMAIVPIYSFLPEWLMFGDIAEIAKNIREKSVKERVLKHLQKIKMDDIIIAEAPPNLKFLEGKPFDDFAKNHGLSKTRALLKLMALSDMKAKLLCSSVAKKVFEEFLGKQRTIVSGGSGSFIAWAGHSGKLLPEKAIAKMTGLPATKYGLKKRGFIKEGFWADIVLWEEWKPKTVVINGSVAMTDGNFVKKPNGAVLRAG